MARRLQNNVSESRMTLPAAAIYATLVWMAGGLVSDGLWMQFGCFAASTYLMVELNNANALIRVYSRMVSCAFIALSCAAAFLFTSAGGAAMELFAIAAYAALFRSYQDRQAAGLTFYAFMSISTGSLFYAEMLYFAPVLWLLMAAFVRSASLRTVAASVLGLCLPYWLAAAIALYTGHLPMLADHLGQLAATGPLCDFSLLSANQVATMAFVMAMAATGIIHYRRQSINDKIRTRMFYSCNGHSLGRTCHTAATTLRTGPAHDDSKHKSADSTFHNAHQHQGDQRGLLRHRGRHIGPYSLQPMDALNELLITYGYIGILIASFLAASILPFSSEVVMVGLLAAGLDPAWLIAYGTVGNVAGSMFNYGLGRLGKPEWIERFLRIKKSDLERAERFMAGRGALMGFFAFVPVIGDAITVMLGLLRANVGVTLLAVTLGKLLRYVALVYGADFFIH